MPIAAKSLPSAPTPPSADPAAENDPPSACFLPVARSLARDLSAARPPAHGPSRARSSDAPSHPSEPSAPSEPSEPSDDELSDRRYSDLSHHTLPPPHHSPSPPRSPRRLSRARFRASRARHTSPGASPSLSPSGASSRASSPFSSAVASSPSPAGEPGCPPPEDSQPVLMSRARSTTCRPVVQPLPVLPSPVQPSMRARRATELTDGTRHGAHALHPASMGNLPSFLPLSRNPPSPDTAAHHTSNSLPRLRRHAYHHPHPGHHQPRQVPRDPDCTSPYFPANYPARPQPIRPVVQPPHSRSRISAIWNFLSLRTRPHRGPRRRQRPSAAAATPATSAPITPPSARAVHHQGAPPFAHHHHHHSAPLNPLSPRDSTAQLRRDWMPESFRMLRRSTTLSADDATPSASPTLSALAAPYSTHAPLHPVSPTSTPTSPTPASTLSPAASSSLLSNVPSPLPSAARCRQTLMSRYARRARSSNTSTSSTTAPDTPASTAAALSSNSPFCKSPHPPSPPKTTTTLHDTASFAALPTVRSLRHAAYDDDKEPHSFAGIRSRFVFTTNEGSSVSSCSDREDDFGFNDMQHLFLSRKQLRAMHLR